MRRVCATLSFPVIGHVEIYARYMVGWRVSRSMQTDFVLDALEQAMYARQPDRDSLIHTVIGDRNTC